MFYEGRGEEEGGRREGKRKERGSRRSGREERGREERRGSRQQFFFHKTHISRFSQQQLGIGIGLQKWNQSMPTWKCTVIGPKQIGINIGQQTSPARTLPSPQFSSLVHNREEEVLVPVSRWEDNGAIQELVNGVCEVILCEGRIGCLMEVLRRGRRVEGGWRGKEDGGGRRGKDSMHV